MRHTWLRNSSITFLGMKKRGASPTLNAVEIHLDESNWTVTDMNVHIHFCSIPDFRLRINAAARNNLSDTTNLNVSLSDTILGHITIHRGYNIRVERCNMSGTLRPAALHAFGSDLTIEGSRFHGNDLSPEEFLILAMDSKSVTIKNSYFHDNDFKNCLISIENMTTVNLHSTILERNTAEDTPYRVAFSVISVKELNIADCSFKANTLPGGFITILDSCDSVSVTHSEFASNILSPSPVFTRDTSSDVKNNENHNLNNPIGDIYSSLIATAYPNKKVIIASNDIFNNSVDNTLHITETDTVQLIDNIFHKNVATRSLFVGGNNAYTNLTSNVFHKNTMLERGSVLDIISCKEVFLSHCNYSQNTCQWGIINMAKTTLLKIETTDFTSNSISEYGCITLSSYVQSYITECNFTENIGALGTILVASTHSSVHMTMCKISNNTISFQPGGFSVRMLFYIFRSSLTLDTSIVERNQYNQVLTLIYSEYATIDLYKSIIGRNVGFRMLQLFHTHITISGSYFYSNSAGVGGIMQMSNSTATITGSGFKWNQAWIGGVFHLGQDSIITLQYCEFSKNRALDGGVFYSTESDIKIADTELQDNKDMIQILAAIFCPLVTCSNVPAISIHSILINLQYNFQNLND